MSLDEIRKEKAKMLEANYSIFSKLLGEPPMKFDLEYYDKDKKYISIANLTPLDFVNKYLSIDLDDYVTLYNFPKYNRELYKTYIRKYDGCIYGSTKTKYLDLPIDDLVMVTLKQLKDGFPVPFVCPTSKMWDRKNWILDTRIFNYKDVLGVEAIGKEDEINFEDINFNHVMNIVGAHVVDDKVVRWRVENSWGTEDNKQQYLVMNNNFFKECIIEISVLKKYLTPEMIETLKQEPIEIDAKSW